MLTGRDERRTRRRKHPRSRTLTSALIALVTTAGCDFFELEGETEIQIFASHHGIVDDDGLFPQYGVDDAPRTFTTGEGWHVIMEKGVAVITKVTLVSCDGSTRIKLDALFGPYPEDFRREDLSVMNIAEKIVPPGEYCALDVTYGPYFREDAAAVEEPHEVANPDDIEGVSIYVRGRATRDEDTVDFEFATAESSVVTLDISKLEDGGPLVIDTPDNRVVNLTILKTYDALFEGIDFVNQAREDVEETLLPKLAAVSYTYWGAAP